VCILWLFVIFPVLLCCTYQKNLAALLGSRPFPEFDPRLFLIYPARKSGDGYPPSTGRSKHRSRRERNGTLILKPSGRAVSQTEDRVLQQEEEEKKIATIRRLLPALAFACAAAEIAD
jgi:hypothetical protein